MDDIGPLILRIFTLVLGLLTVSLTGIGYSKPFVSPHETRLRIGDQAELQASDACKNLTAKVKQEIEELSKKSTNTTNTNKTSDEIIEEIKNKQENLLRNPTCNVQKHVFQDELVFSMVIIILILSIIFFVHLMCVLKNPNLQNANAIDVPFHLLGGLILLIVAIIWVISLMERTIDLEEGIKRELKFLEELSKCEAAADEKCKENARIESAKGRQRHLVAENKYGELNIIYINELPSILIKECGSASGKIKDDQERQKCEREKEVEYENKLKNDEDRKAEGTYKLVLIDGILISINAFVYFEIAALAIIIKGQERGQVDVESAPEDNANSN